MLQFLPDLILKNAELYQNKEALRDDQGALTYGELSQKISQLAGVLRESNPNSLGRILLIINNSIHFVISHFAAILSGGISVPCEPNISHGNLKLICKDCQPEILIIQAGQLKRLARSLPETGIKKVIVLDGDAEPPPGLEIIPQDRIKDGPLEFAGTGMKPQEPAVILYTTGSTGRPKGVVLNHTTILTTIGHISKYLEYSESAREVVALPLSHSFGLGQLYCNLLKGGSVRIISGLNNPAKLLNSLESFQATGFPGTPLTFSLILEKFRLERMFAQKGRSLRFIVVDSAPLPPSLAKKIMALLPQVDLYVYYGLTEASRSTFIRLNGQAENRMISVGKPLPGVQIKIVDENGESLPRGQTGEVVITGTNLAEGYWNNPALTKEAFINGWFRSKDLGTLDDEGYLTLSGRMDDVVNIGGFKVNPHEVEQIIKSYPEVDDAAVLGFVLGSTGGEPVLIASLVASGREGMDMLSLKRFCQKRLENYKVPAKFVLVSSIPRSTTGKTLRKEMEKELRSKLAEKAEELGSE
jgi:long-chain acyl-CoA synthetase